MAIPADPHRSQIKAEFGNATYQANIQNGSLKQMHNYILNSTTTFSRDDFEGYGQPSVGTPSEVSVAGDSSSITISFSVIEVNNLDCNVIVDFSLVSDFSTIDFSDFIGSYSTIGSKQHTSNGDQGNGFTADETYYVRLRYYNKFNDVPADHSTTNDIMITTPKALQTGTTLSATSVTDESFSASVDIDSPLIDSYVDFWFDVWEGHTQSGTVIASSLPETVLTAGIKGKSFSGLDADTDYSFQAFLENNQGINSLNVVYVTTDPPPQGASVPFIDSYTDNGFDLGESAYSITLDFSNLTATPVTYEASWSNDNGSTWSTPVDLVNLTTPSNDSQSGDLLISGQFQAPDKVRMRAVKNGNPSLWSNEITI